jgi:hypothetical protein
VTSTTVKAPQITSDALDGDDSDWILYCHEAPPETRPLVVQEASALWAVARHLDGLIAAKVISPDYSTWVKDHGTKGFYAASRLVLALRDDNARFMCFEHDGDDLSHAQHWAAFHPDERRAFEAEWRRIIQERPLEPAPARRPLHA